MFSFLLITRARHGSLGYLRPNRINCVMLLADWFKGCSFPSGLHKFAYIQYFQISTSLWTSI